MNSRLTMPMILLATILVCSCEAEDPFNDYTCKCHNADNRIDGWDEKKDSTLIDDKDTVSGFEVVVDGWQNSDTLKIHL